MKWLAVLYLAVGAPTMRAPPITTVQISYDMLEMPTTVTVSDGSSSYDATTEVQLSSIYPADVRRGIPTKSVRPVTQEQFAAILDAAERAKEIVPPLINAPLIMSSKVVYSVGGNTCTFFVRPDVREHAVLIRLMRDASDPALARDAQKTCAKRFNMKRSVDRRVPMLHK